MHTSSLITTLLFFTLSCNTSTFGMITYKDLEHPDIGPHIYKHLSPEDRADCRLVCKKWADGNDQPQFMPDSIEKQYDAMMEKKGKIDHQLIFLNLISENDLNAVKWLSYRGRNKHLNTCLYCNDIKIDIMMIAIHNKTREMARFLCEIHPDYRNTKDDWKIHYKTITAPHELQQYMYPSHDRDFSFIPYIIAVLSDNSFKLQRLYTQKIPTKIGNRLLIGLCPKNNAFQCFNFLLTNQDAQQRIKEGSWLLNCLTDSLENNHQKIIEVLIKSKLYNINETVTENKTILDYYNQKEQLPNRTNALIILKDLGAKTSKEIEQEKRNADNCIIQ